MAIFNLEESKKNEFLDESKNVKTYDKVKWHIDGGENKNNVMNKFHTLFSFLKSKSMLNNDGLIEYENIGYDTVIRSDMLTQSGCIFMDEEYDNYLKGKSLKECYHDYLNKFNKKSIKEACEYILSVLDEADELSYDDYIKRDYKIIEKETNLASKKFIRFLRN